MTVLIWILIVLNLLSLTLAPFMVGKHRDPITGGVCLFSMAASAATVWALTAGLS